MIAWQKHDEYPELYQNAESRGERRDELREARAIIQISAFMIGCFALAAAVWKWWPK